MQGFASRLVGAAILAVAVATSTGGTARAQGQGVWHGVVADSPNIRRSPSTAAPIVGPLPAGASIQIQSWVRGERVAGVNDTWGEIGPGRFIYSSLVRKPRPAAPRPRRGPSPGAGSTPTSPSRS